MGLGSGLELGSNELVNHHVARLGSVIEQCAYLVRVRVRDRVKG
jgi:hypothetical protein